MANKIFINTDNTQDAAVWEQLMLWSGLPADQYVFGFVTTYNGTQETTISFDGTNTFTLAPTGTTWSYYRNGIRYKITGSKTATLSGTPPADKGHYYIYIDDTDGTLTVGTTSWTLEDTKVPVATVAWDNTLTPKYWLSDERHTCAIDRRYHWEHHFSDGTEVVTLPALSGYTVNPASPADTDNTFAISAGILSDEDIKIILAELADQNGTDTNYVVEYISSSLWYWEYSAVPFRYTAAGYIQYNNAGTMTEGDNNKWYNWYLVLTNRQGLGRFVFLPGMGEYASLSDAQAEQFSDNDFTAVHIDEYVAVYQLIFRTNSSYTTKGKCRLAVAPIEISISASGSGSPGATTWGNIVGDITNQIDITYGNISAIDTGTDVTAAELEELSDGSVTTLHDHDVTGLNNWPTINYNYVSGNDAGTDITAAELEELSDGSETTLHSHAGAGGGQYRAMAWSVDPGGGWIFESLGDAPGLLLTDLE